MKKNLIIIPLLIIMLTVIFSVPQLFTRIKYESAHMTYTVALDIEDVNEKYIQEYKKNGADTALIRNISDDYLTLCEENGLDIALCLPDKKDLPEFEKTIKNHNVKYLLLKENDGFIPAVCEITKSKGLTVVLAENIPQNGNEKPQGLEEYLTASEGRILRSYETLETSCVSHESYDAIYYQMLNSAHDRNTEFILVNQLTDSETEAENAERTIRSVKKFCDKMETLGYKKGETSSLYGYNPPARGVYAASAAIMCLMALAVILTLFKNTDKKIIAGLYILSVLSFGITYILPEGLLRLYPTLFAAISPCFILSSVNYKAKELKSGILANTAILIVTAFFLCALSGIVIASLLSGSEYYLCLKVFIGVKLALICAPALAVFIFIYENGLKNIPALMKKNMPLTAAIIIFVLIYLIRSGNTSISEGERILRNFFTEIAPARPRTKEFLIGWPCLFGAAFFLYQDKHKILRGLILIGCAILFSSAINSFCHVFTDVTTVFARLSNGLLFSLPLSGCVLLIVLLKKKNIS